jgi:hypothetical protein
MKKNKISRMKTKAEQKHCFIESIRPCASSCMAAYTVKGQAHCLILWGIKNAGYAAEREDGIVQKEKNEAKVLTNFEKIEIIGSPRYVSRITQFLKLLKEKAPRAFITVRKYIGRIEDGFPSGMAAWESTPTYFCNKKTAFAETVTFGASCIVHEAHHSKLYLDYKKKYKKTPPRSVDSGRKIELECIKRQIVAAKQIGAPDDEIQYLEKQDGTHYKQKITW